MMLTLAQHSLAIAALLFAFIVGPETHVHPGESPHSEALVHAHSGIVGHTHTHGNGLSELGEGPATYINAYSVTPGHAVQIPNPSNVSKVPPGIELGHLRAPPFALPV
jgi:hypothetical protein